MRATNNVTIAAALVLLLGPHAFATPPDVPWRAWERTAREAGAEAVRGHYRQAIDGASGELRNLPDDGTDANFQRRLILTGTVIEFLDSWALVELREVHARGVTPQLDETVWPQLLADAHAVVDFKRTLAARSRPRRAAQAPGQPAHWSITLMDGLDANADHLAWRLALLAKSCDDAPRVGQVFGLFGGTIGTHTTPQSFIATRHDMPRLIQMTPPVPPDNRRRAVPDSLQRAATDHIQNLFTAIRHTDAAALRRMTGAVDPAVSPLLPHLVEDLADADLERAVFGFSADDPATLAVCLSGVVTRRGQGRDRVVHVRALTFTFRVDNNDLTLTAIGGVR